MASMVVAKATPTAKAKETLAFGVVLKGTNQKLVLGGTNSVTSVVNTAISPGHACPVAKAKVRSHFGSSIRSHFGSSGL